MKCVSIFSVTLKSAMTPSFIGLMATTLPGVRPSMSFASRPTATTSLVFLLMATMEGSLTTMPLPLANTSVFAVPRSMARSDDKRLKTERKLYPFLLIMSCYWSEPFSGVVSQVAQRRSPSLWNHNGHALNGRASSSVLADDYDFMASACKRLREVAEAAVGLNIGDGVAVNDER